MLVNELSSYTIHLGFLCRFIRATDDCELCARARIQSGLVIESSIYDIYGRDILAICSWNVVKMCILYVHMYLCIMYVYEISWVC